MIKQKAQKLFTILLFCCSCQQINAVDFTAVFAGVFLTLFGLVSDEKQQNDKSTQSSKQRHQNQSIHVQQKPDKQQLFDSIEKKLRELTDIDNQSTVIKEGLWKKKQEVVTDTLKQNFATHAKAEKEAFKLLPSGIREFYVTKVIEIAQSKITSSRKEQDLKKIEEYFGHQIDQKLSIKKPVTDLFKNINTDVDSYIKHMNYQKYRAVQESSLYDYFTPSAPRIEDFDE